MMAGEVKFPIQDVVMPMLPGALDRAVANADPTAGWLPQVAREVASLSLKCVDKDESKRPCFTEICRHIRHLQECFPPTSVLAPQVSFSTPNVPPMPGMTGACGPSPPNFGGPPAAPEQGMSLLPGPGPQGPGPPPGSFWMQGPVGGGQTVAGPPFPGATLPPPVLAPGGGGSVRLPPGASLAPGFQPQPPQHSAPGMFEAQAPPAWPVTAMAPVAAGPPVSMAPMPQPGAPPPLPVGVPVMAVPEVALEITYVHLAVLSTMRPAFRMLPLAPSVDAEGRRSARLGRAHQPQWFEAVLLDAGDLSCISREACEFCWGGPDPAKAGLVLRVLGSTPVVVDDEMVNRGGTAPLRPGSRITLAMQTCPGGELCIIMSLAVHCASAPPFAGSPGRRNSGMVPGAQQTAALEASPAPPDRRSVLVHVETVNVKDKAASSSPPRPVQLPGLEMQVLPQESCWSLECIYASGLAPEAFLALPSVMRKMSFALAPGLPAMLIGRQHQPEMFEAMLGRENSLLAFVSRNHFRLEVGESGTVKVTNMSQNIAVVAQRPLHQNDGVEVVDGDTLSFAHTVAQEASRPSAGQEGSSIQEFGLNPIDATVNIVPFLTMRLVGPPPPTPASPFEMLTSLPVVSPTVAAEAPSPKVRDAATPRGASGSLRTAEVPEEAPATAMAPATLPLHQPAREAVRIEGVAVGTPSTPPMKNMAPSSLLCNADSVQTKGGECELM